MAYKKRYRRYRRRAGKSAGVKALRGVKSLKKMIGHPEIKWSDATNASFTNVPTIGYTSSLMTSISQGASGNNNRIGDVITAKTLEVRFDMRDLGFNASTYRLIVVIDRENQGLGTSSVFPGFNTILGPLTPLDEALFMQARSFKILHDSTYCFGGSNSAYKVSRVLKINLKNLKIPFIPTSSTPQRNALRVYAISDIDNASTPPTLLWYARLRFTDV